MSDAIRNDIYSWLKRSLLGRLIIISLVVGAILLVIWNAIPKEKQIIIIDKVIDHQTKERNCDPNKLPPKEYDKCIAKTQQ